MTLKQINWKGLIPDAIILVVFIVASIIYFFPALEGKVVYAGDNVNGLAAVHESSEYIAEGGNSFWTGSMFSGMPNYQIGGHKYLSSIVLRPLYRFFHWGHRNTVFILLFYLVAFYCLLRAFKVQKWVSMAGAFAMALSSYFFIIIAAQHHAKCTAITWMTMVVVGFIVCYRKRYVWAMLLTMLFVPMGFFIHPQMSYYICMLIGILFCAELFIHIKERRMLDFGLSTLIFAFSFAVGMGIGSADIFANSEYAEQTMRGGHSDLEKVTDEQNKTKGLDLDYATTWSYGIDETMTLLIPNFMGGASGYNVGEKSELYKNLTANHVPSKSAKDFCKGAPTYRGDKPFTSGPVYAGAIVCFLFLLGIIIVSGPYKWALLIATLFSIMLAWGRHFMPLTELFFHYFPVYNKFRAVESILIVAEITIPLLGFLAVRDIINGKIGKIKLRVGLIVATAVTGSVCLLFALFPGIVDFTSTYDRQWVAQMPDFVYDAVLAQRKSMLRSDAWRSLLFVLLGAGSIFAYLKIKDKKMKVSAEVLLGVVLTALIVADMWTVDKRYCNDSQFISRQERDRAFKMLPYEKDLLADPDYFRVLNLTTNTFNEARTSYYLKSIGGYSAAKLRRYQDLIDQHIAPEMNPLMQAIASSYGFATPVNADSIFPVLNMLNMKYAIVPLQGGQQAPVLNPYAMGNAWFVDEVQLVDNANEECDALSHVNLHKTAVADKQFADQATITTSLPDTTAQIVLTSYKPDELHYNAHLATAKTAVFSEIYYPFGWKAYVDGQLTEHFRVNYMLRAINLTEGNHEVVFRFEPESVKKGNTLALICIILAAVSIVGGIIITTLLRRRQS